MQHFEMVFGFCAFSLTKLNTINASPLSRLCHFTASQSAWLVRSGLVGAVLGGRTFVCAFAHTKRAGKMPAQYFASTRNISSAQLNYMFT